jgi:HEPN domain-containing protein
MSGVEEVKRVTGSKWEKWWQEAEAHSAVAGEHLAAERYSFAAFAALQAMELASKALVMLAPNYGDLQGLSYGELRGVTYGQLASGIVPPKTHNLQKILDVPWVKGDARDIMLRTKASLERELGVKDLYMAARYPDQWAEDRPAPSKAISAEHAISAMSAMAGWMHHCRQRFANRTDQSSTDSGTKTTRST